MPSRRQLLMGIALSLGGAAAFASCQQGLSKGQPLPSYQPNGKPQFYTEQELQLVASLADAIIPRTKTPGALDVNVPQYLDAMMVDWASDNSRKAHRQALALVGQRLRELGGCELIAMSIVARDAVVLALDNEVYGQSDAAPRARPDSLAGAYVAIKGLIADTYYGSEAGATQELQYEHIPGRWLPDAPLTEIGRTWSSFR